MTWHAFAAEPAHLPTGAWLASRFAGLGASGAAIKAASLTGEQGPGPLINDSLSDDAEYWWYVATPPASGTLAITEDGQATLTVPSDGVYTWAYSLKENGALLPGPRTVVAVVGAAPATYALTVPGGASASVISSPAITYVPPGGPTYTLAVSGTSSASAASSPAIIYTPPGSTTYNLLPASTVSASVGSSPAITLGSVSIFRPDADLAAASWAAVPAGSLYSALDEVSANDADYITSLIAGAAPAVLGIGPLASGTYTLRVRAGTDSGSGVLRVRLLAADGSVLAVTPDQAIAAAPSTYAFTLTISGTATRVAIDVA